MIILTCFLLLFQEISIYYHIIINESDQSGHSIKKHEISIYSPILTVSYYIVISVVKKHVFLVGEIKQCFFLFFVCFFVFFFKIKQFFFFFKFHEILNIRKQLTMSTKKSVEQL